MKKELQDKLVSYFPSLYIEKSWDSFYSPMAFGFCVGDGWFDIIWNLSTKIDSIIKGLPENERHLHRVVQVKEKFGGLRFYMSVNHVEIEKAIDEATRLSLITCEKCGKPGKMDSNGGWFQTICNECPR